jgi:hypothetical protein
MKRHLFFLAVVLVAALTVFSGVLQGRLRNRWGASADTSAAAEKLKQMPSQFGDWRLRLSQELDQTALSQLDPAGYLVSHYANQVTGDLVTVTLLLGSPGPISVHIPEVCLPSRNYQSQGERRRVAIRRADGTDDELWTLDYRASNIRGDLLRMYYGWSTGDRWSAAEDPRFFFASQPYLYKIQISYYMPPAASGQSSDPCQKFLEDFLPVARKHLVEPSKKK